MPPYADSQATGVLFESDIQTSDGGLDKEVSHLKQTNNKKLELIWPHIIWFLILHPAALYGLYLSFTEAKWQTNVFGVTCYVMSGFGITAGVHRLWCHKSYKAKFPLRTVLMIWNTMAFQNPIFAWARDHRIHHKYSDTDADPHNSFRGLLFSHVGWLCSRKNEEVKSKGRQIDMSDLYADPLVVFQKKYYSILMPLFCFVLPTVIPMYYWNESFSCALCIPALLRYAFVLNATWAVNSFAHAYGYKPYDASLNPGENIGVSMVALGEGFHNYHHAFPWDYKAAELPFYTLPNPTTAFIDLMAWIGQATDLKTVSTDMVKRRTIRTGDGTHQLWGWGDKDLNSEHKNVADIKYKSR